MSDNQVEIKDNTQTEILQKVPRKTVKHEMREERKEENRENKEKKKSEKKEKKEKKKEEKRSKKINKIEKKIEKIENQDNAPEEVVVEEHTVKYEAADRGINIDNLPDINDSDIVSVDPSEIPDDISLSFSSINTDDIPDDISLSMPDNEDNEDNEDSIDVPKKVVFNTESDLSPEIPLEEAKVPQSTPNARKDLGFESKYMTSSDSKPANNA